MFFFPRFPARLEKSESAKRKGLGNFSINTSTGRIARDQNYRRVIFFLRFRRYKIVEKVIFLSRKSRGNVCRTPEPNDVR